MSKNVARKWDLCWKGVGGFGMWKSLVNLGWGVQLRVVERGIGALRCSPFLLKRDIQAALFHACFQQLYSVVFIMLIWDWRDGASITLALRATVNFTVEWIISLPMHFDLLVLCTVNKWDLCCIRCRQSAFGCCQKLPGVNYLNWTFLTSTFLKAKELWSLYNNLVLGKVSFFFCNAVCRGTEF